MIFVGAHPDGCAIFKADGNYEDRGKTRTAFSAGDVFVPCGGASVPWRQEDIGPILDRAINTRKEEWRAEVTATWAEQLEAARLVETVRGAPPDLHVATG